jgi:hypothetical protein
MAGALIRRKVRESEGLSVNDDDRDVVPSYLLELPGDSSRIKDLNLAVLLGRQVISNFISTWTASKIGNILNCNFFLSRSWQSRRVVYSRDVIAFARLDEDVLLDAIPLAEVIGIDSMQEVDQNDISKNNFEASVDFTHAFQIRTKRDGYNAGRKYFVQANSDQELAQLVAEISRVAKVAAEREAERSKWERMQKKVQKIYNHSWFQGVAAFLIIAVLPFMPTAQIPLRAAL